MARYTFIGRIRRFLSKWHREQMLPEPDKRCNRAADWRKHAPERGRFS